MRKSLKLKKLTCVQQVCEHLDVQVLYDITEIHGEENNPKVHQVCAIGSPPELSAGLRGFVVTKWFDSPEELEDFCQRHLQRFLASKEDEPAPDATEWE